MLNGVQPLRGTSCSLKYSVSQLPVSDMAYDRRERLCLCCLLYRGVLPFHVRTTVSLRIILIQPHLFPQSFVHCISGIAVLETVQGWSHKRHCLFLETSVTCEG